MNQKIVIYLPCQQVSGGTFGADISNRIKQK